MLDELLGNVVVAFELWSVLREFCEFHDCREVERPDLAILLNEHSEKSLDDSNRLLHYQVLQVLANRADIRQTSILEETRDCSEEVASRQSRARDLKKRVVDTEPNDPLGCSLVLGDHQPFKCDRVGLGGDKFLYEL